MAVVISPNIKKESVRINPDGNIIDPKSKKVIQKEEAPYIPSTEELNKFVQSPQAPVGNATSPKADLSILEQIEQAKALLASLEAKKKEEIALRKKELEELEK